MNYYICNGELYHHGIKGMKWGVRRYQNKNGSLTPAGKKRYAAELDDSRAAYKSAKDAKINAKANRTVAKGRYDDSFNRAYNYSDRNSIGQYTNKTKRATSNRLWEEAKNDKASYEQSKKDYKQSKKDYKQAKRDFKEAKTNAKYEKYGLDPTNTNHIVNVNIAGYKGAQRIQNRINTKNMSDFKATSIEIGRQYAGGVLTAVGVVGAAALVSKYSNPTMSVLDASGKVIKRFYN